MDTSVSTWDEWVDEALLKLQSLKLSCSFRPIHLQNAVAQQSTPDANSPSEGSPDFRTFDGPRKWDRVSVEVKVSESTFQKWLHDVPSLGEDDYAINEKVGDNFEADLTDGKLIKLVIFSGNDYLALSSHPTVCGAASKTALEHGMGPKGSALICGYTTNHKLLESYLANLKRKEDCLLCPTVFSANMAFMTAVGSIVSLLSGGNPESNDRVAVFSDSLNHASIIDGIRLAEKQGNSVTFVYRHCDMSHLDALLSKCPMKKKGFVTDSLFSMDGDFAPMSELAKLRKNHGFLFVIDGAHATFVCGKGGGGAAEKFNCEADVDICIGTLSKASSKKWKLLIQSRGRSFIFSTSMPVPVAAAAHAAVRVAKQESWRRRDILKCVQEFHSLTGIPVQSHIILVVIGREDKALQASQHLLKSGFHVTAIRPPTILPNPCRLQVTLSAAHTSK